MITTTAACMQQCWKESRQPCGSCVSFKSGKDVAAEQETRHAQVSAGGGTEHEEIKLTDLIRPDTDHLLGNIT